MFDLPSKLEGARDYLHMGWSQQDVESALLGMHRRRRRKRRVRAVLLASSACLVALGSAQLWRGTKPETPGGLPSSVTAEHRLPTERAAAVRPRETTLADGSRWQPLDEHSRIIVREVSPGRVRLSLASGAARFEVARVAHRTFEVLAGEVRVEVLGTIFSVHRTVSTSGERVKLEVSEGRVRVEWRTGAAILRAGESRWFPPERSTTASAKPRSPARPRQRPDELGWRKLARAGRYEEAYRRLAEAGRGRTSRPVRDEAADLFLAADAARLAGYPEQALPYLQRIIAQHPHDGRAALAAFTSGRILLQGKHYAEAARAFANARALARDDSLAEDALAREVEAWAGAGRVDLARRKARDYLERYPAGRRVATVRRKAGLVP